MVEGRSRVGGGVHTPDRRDRRLLVYPPKDTGKAGRRNCQNSEAKLPQRDSNPAGTVWSPLKANALTHSATALPGS